MWNLSNIDLLNTDATSSISLFIQISCQSVHRTFAMWIDSNIIRVGIILTGYRLTMYVCLSVFAKTYSRISTEITHTAHNFGRKKMQTHLLFMFVCSSFVYFVCACNIHSILHIWTCVCVYSLTSKNLIICICCLLNIPVGICDVLCGKEMERLCVP